LFVLLQASRGKTSTAGDLSSSGLGKGLKASGNGSLLDFSTSFRQLPTGSDGTAGGDGEQQRKNGGNQQGKEKKRKEKEREKNAEAYGRKIDWTGRDLKTLPEKLYEFSNFDGLTKLVLRANQLSAFPGELSMLRGLTYLDYSENLIRGARVLSLPLGVCCVSSHANAHRAAQGDWGDVSIEGAPP
jgi:Leucine-rich repeat (LRR) protein